MGGPLSWVFSHLSLPYGGVFESGYAPSVTSLVLISSFQLY